MEFIQIHKGTEEQRRVDDEQMKMRVIGEYLADAYVNHTPSTGTLPLIPSPSLQRTRTTLFTISSHPHSNDTQKYTKMSIRTHVCPR